MRRRGTYTLLWLEIEFVSLLSITFILIMFLSLANLFTPLSSVAQPKQFGINLPSAVVTIPISQEKNGFLIIINSSDDVYVGDSMVGVNGLTASLSSYIHQYGTPTSVKIAADKAASYGTVVQVMDLLRKDGISTVDMIVGQAQ